MPSALRCLVALVVMVLWPSALSPLSTTSVAWAALFPESEGASTTSVAVTRSAEVDLHVDEMLRGSKGRLEHWTDAPELVVLTSVMQFQAGGSTSYVATSDVLSDEEAEGLVTDLSTALSLLTGGAFERFASVRRESIAAGESTRVIRKNQIVVGRYRGVMQQAGVLGLGGRSARTDGAITGAAVVLDDEYDRSAPLRTLLRTHELGHALGFNHVQSRESIMNPRIGPAATDLDRRIATLAYAGRPEFSIAADFLSR